MSDMIVKGRIEHVRRVPDMDAVFITVKVDMLAMSFSSEEMGVLKARPKEGDTVYVRIVQPAGEHTLLPTTR